MNGSVSSQGMDRHLRRIGQGVGRIGHRDPVVSRSDGPGHGWRGGEEEPPQQQRPGHHNNAGHNSHHHIDSGLGQVFNTMDIFLNNDHVI